MENQTIAEEENNPNNDGRNPQSAALIATFCEITSSSKEEAQFFLESHGFDLDSAVSTFLETTADSVAATDAAAILSNLPGSQSPVQSQSYSPPSSSPSRSRSPSPPRGARSQSSNAYNLRSRESRAPSGASKKKASTSRTGGIRTLADLNRRDKDSSGSDDDEPQEYYTGGEKSGMLVQDPSKGNDVDSIFAQARQMGAVERPQDHLQPPSGSGTFRGTARLLSGETISSAPPQPPEVITHNIIFWSNGFTVDDGPLRRLDDPENAPFLESIRNSECPKELEPADRRTKVHVSLMRKEENYNEPEKRRLPFQGVGRTLGSTSTSTTTTEVELTVGATTPLTTAPPPSQGLIVDKSLPSTSIQLRLADGTRMVSRFNHHHTIGDIRAFIDASRPGGPRNYQLQTVGFPPKQLADQNQTIDEAGLANSVVIQKF